MRVLGILALLLVWTALIPARSDAQGCCVCRGGGCGTTGFCTDGMSSLVGCATFCSGTGCTSGSFEPGDACEGGCGVAGAVPTATPSSTPTHTGTPTSSPSASPTVTPTSSASATATVTSTSTATPTSPICCANGRFCADALKDASGKQFCDQGVEVPDSVCVNGSCMVFTATPTLTTTPTPANTGTPTKTPTTTPSIPMNVDPYKCYRVKPHSNFSKRKIQTTDGFGHTVTTVIKPFFFCRPSSRASTTPGPNATPAALHYPGDNLICYKIKDDDRIQAPKNGISTRNQIIPGQENPEQYDVLRSQLICLPTLLMP